MSKANKHTGFMMISIIKRQKILLRMISRSGASIDKLRLMKLSFLYANHTIHNCCYRFVPHVHGPFSFTLHNELNKLQEKGLLSFARETRVSMDSRTPSECFLLDSSIEDEFEIFWKEYSGLTTRDMADYVYREYPWFTIHCEHEDQRAEKVKAADCAIYTVGCEGLHVDEFLNLLLLKGIQCIIDVRANPASRVYGFHKSTLSRIAGSLDIQYIHFPELGIPHVMRVTLESAEDYEALFSHYRNRTLRNNAKSIDAVLKLMNQQPAVLMCQEADPAHCHRSHLAQALHAHSQFEVQDIRQNNECLSVN